MKTARLLPRLPPSGNRERSPPPEGNEISIALGDEGLIHDGVYGGGEVRPEGDAAGHEVRALGPRCYEPHPIGPCCFTKADFHPQHEGLALEVRVESIRLRAPPHHVEPGPGRAYLKGPEAAVIQGKPVKGMEGKARVYVYPLEEIQGIFFRGPVLHALVVTVVAHAHLAAPLENEDPPSRKGQVDGGREPGNARPGDGDWLLLFHGARSVSRLFSRPKNSAMIL